MKISFLTSCLFVSSTVIADFYPSLKKNGAIPENLVPFELGDDVQIDCISRQIDNGEHKFDENKNIIYTAFPICKETGRPLTFKYGVNEDLNCTIGFTDELYHLFQLYIHEDAPFSCRVPLSKEQHYVEKGGAYVPLTFNFRGDLYESHLEVDSNMNVVFTTPNSHEDNWGSLISSVAWSASTNTTRVVIGDYMTIQLAVRWMENLKAAGSIGANFKNNGLPFKDGFYKFPLDSGHYIYKSFYLFLLLAFIAVAVFSSLLSRKVVLGNLKHGGFIKVDAESGYSKQD